MDLEKKNKQRRLDNASPSLALLETLPPLHSFRPLETGPSAPFATFNTVFELPLAIAPPPPPHKFGGSAACTSQKDASTTVSTVSTADAASSAAATVSSAMTKAVCKRASRMARPAEPSTEKYVQNHRLVKQSEAYLIECGRRRVYGEVLLKPAFRHALASTGKGPAVRVDTGADDTDVMAQSTMNHMCVSSQGSVQPTPPHRQAPPAFRRVSIKSRHVESGSQDPPWLLDVKVACPQMYGRLAAAAIKSNAVNSSVTNRAKTQGAANQTSRINCRAIAQAAAAQVAAVAMSMALARREARVRAGEKYMVANPMATNSANPCVLWCASVNTGLETLFPITMSSRLVFNSAPTKMGAGCVLHVARVLAHRELDECAISERVGSSNFMLTGICRAISSPGEYALDAVWASWVLVVYLCCHPEGRVLLRDTGLTDVDYQTSTAFEAYGRAEITRRARLEAQQQSLAGRKRQKAESGPRNEGKEEEAQGERKLSVVEQVAMEERKTLATKRKRGAKGCASASTSDSSGMMQW